METKIKLSKLKVNPANPRQIRDERFEILKKSLTEFPEMLVKRPIAYDETNDNMVLGGTQRLKALKELGYKEIPENWTVKCGDWSEEQKQRFIISDNVELGEFNFDMLADFDKDLLVEWGVELPQVFEGNLDDFFQEDNEPEKESVDKIVLNYTEEDCKKVKESLLKIAKTYEQAVWKLLEL